MASLGHNELNIEYPFPHIYQHPPPNIYQYPFHLQITMITGMSHEWISSAGVFKYVYMCFSNTILFFFFLARWLTSARAYRIGGRKLCPSVCLYVKRYLLLQFCTDYNQTWINMIWAVAAKTLLSQIFHNWRRIEVNCVYISHCKWYRTSAGMPACIPNRRCCAGQCAGQ